MPSVDDTLQLLHARVKALFPVETARGALALSEIDLGSSRSDPRNHLVGPFLLTPCDVSLGLRTTGSDGRSSQGACTLCAADDVHDARLGPYVEGMILALHTILDRASDASISNWAIGYFNVGLPLDVFEPGVSAAEVRDYFLTYPWLGRLLPERPAKAPAYVLAPPRAVLRADGSVAVERLWMWIWQQAQRTFKDRRWDDAMRAALPLPVRVLAALHTIHSMVGGNGFEVFLAQASGAEVREAYDALVVASAERLRELMAKGIGLAARQGAEFTAERGKKWLQPFESEPAASWSEVDGPEPDRSYALLESELVPAAVRYANAHLGAVVHGVLSPPLATQRRPRTSLRRSRK